MAFLPSLAGGFLGDDFVYVARFLEMPWSEWPRLFTRDWSGGVWGSPMYELRPFTGLSFMIDARLHGGWAPGYRLTNLVLHLLATWFVLRLTWRYSEGNLWATGFAAVIFGLHPAHAEPVVWITGRVDLLATVCALGFWLAAEIHAGRGGLRWAVLAWIALSIGVFSKELTLSAPLLLLVWWTTVKLRVPRQTWIARATLVLGVIVVIGIYAVCRHAAFGAEKASTSLWTSAAGWSRQASCYGWLIPILPFLDRLQWENPPSLETLHGLWVAFAAGILVGLIYTAIRRWFIVGSVVFFGGVWVLLTVTPFVGVGYFSPRHLYFPTIGVALAGGLALGTLVRSFRLRVGVGALLLAWCVSGHFISVQPWNDAGKISRRALAAIERELAYAPSNTLLLTSVPEAFHWACLWAWASPACAGTPFVSRPVPSTHVIERPGNYAQTDRWTKERDPMTTLRSASSDVIVLIAELNKTVSCRRVPASELHANLPALSISAENGLTGDEWTEWVRSIR